MNIKRCPKCGVGFKAGVSACPSCSCDLISEEDYKPAIEKRLQSANRAVQLFTFNPYGNGLETGAYENLGLVSAYMALGTGPISQLLSSWTDFFGEESKTYNEKMTSATDACIFRIKKMAHEMEADSVIGVQTTFTELTAAHGQILVCMIGTAVKKVGALNLAIA